LFVKTYAHTSRYPIPKCIVFSMTINKIPIVGSSFLIMIAKVCYLTNGYEKLYVGVCDFTRITY